MAQLGGGSRVLLTKTLPLFRWHGRLRPILACTFKTANLVRPGTQEDRASCTGNLRSRRFYSSGSDAGDGWSWSGRWGVGATGAAVLATIGVTLYLNTKSTQCKEAVEEGYGLRKANLPNYRRAEIAQHTTADKRIWVTFKNGVYDVTDFIEGHPGGTKLLLAAGKQLEPFFEVYAVHKSEEVMEMMEELRIGNVHIDDMKEAPKGKTNDPFANDPKRHPALQINSEKPFNAEPPAELLTDSFNTPNDLFFVRNHLPVPKIDASNFRLEILGEGVKRPISFTVENLKKKFPVYTIGAAVQCAGNRRSEMAQVKSVKGLSWGTTAISNAEWTGVKLTDVLDYVGAKEDKVSHVIFQGLDKDVEGIPYEASIPAATAFDPKREVLLAFEMNGKELPLDHGYPLRAVVPGVVGARQVKWLSKIIISKEESKSHWQQNDYKSFHPSIDWHNVDFSKSVAIQEYPIQSAICEPTPGSKLSDSEEVTVKGYAWSGGGRGILRVDVSLDGGKTWHTAELEKAAQKLHREWAWTLFTAAIPIPKDHKGKLDIVCKAVDTSHNTQPETPSGIWNLRGLINNAWHHVHVDVPKD